MTKRELAEGRMRCIIGEMISLQHINGSVFRAEAWSWRGLAC